MESSFSWPEEDYVWVLPNGLHVLTRQVGLKITRKTILHFCATDAEHPKLHSLEFQISRTYRISWF